MFSFAYPVFLSLLQMAALIGLGFFFQRRQIFKPAFFEGLNQLVARWALPMYFFAKFSRASLEEIQSSALAPLSAVIICLATLAVSFGVFLILGFKGKQLRIATALGGFGNYGYIPLSLIELIPLTLPIVGEMFGTSLPTLYVGTFLLFSSPFLWSLGYHLISGRETRFRLRDLINPPLIGIICGLLVPITGLGSILFRDDLPFLPIVRAMSQLGSVTLPLILVSLGALMGKLKAPFETHGRGTMLKVLAGTIAVRLVIMPAVFFVALALFLKPAQLAPAYLWLFFLEVCTPTATNFTVMASGSRMSEDWVAFTLMGAYLAYLVVLPFHLMLFLGMLR